jgi:hypothetical protein
MAVVEVVRGLPVVEDLVAVLDGRECGSSDVGDGKDEEGDVGSRLRSLLDRLPAEVSS